MEPGKLCLLLTFIIYAIFCDARIIYIFLSIGGILAVFHLLTPGLYNSTRRKLMIASWAEPQEGCIHAKYEANLTQVHEYIKEAREKLGVKVTLVHVLVRIMASVLQELPDVNGRIVFGKYFPYDRVNVSCLVDIDEGKDLAVALVEDADKKTIEDITEYIVERASKIKSHKDEIHKNQTSTFKPLPSFLIAFMLQIAEFIGVDIGIGIRALSLKKFQFGGTMITNVGAMGVKDAFAPFTPFARVPILVTLCETVKKPIVKDDKIVIAPITAVNFTIDHRFMDGGRVKKVLQKLDECFNDPYALSRLKKAN